MDLLEIQKNADSHLRRVERDKQRIPTEMLEAVNRYTVMLVELGRILLDDEKFKLWSANVFKKLK